MSTTEKNEVNLRREAACFAFLSSKSRDSIRAIEDIGFEATSRDFHNNIPTVAMELYMKCAYGEPHTELFSFFRRPVLAEFVRTFIQAASQRSSFTMKREVNDGTFNFCEHILLPQDPAVEPEEIVFQSLDNLVRISARWTGGSEEPLLNLPRSESFMRLLCKAAAKAHETFRGLEREMIVMYRDLHAPEQIAHSPPE
jgi:hypothetical protein